MFKRIKQWWLTSETPVELESLLSIATIFLLLFLIWLSAAWLSKIIPHQSWYRWVLTSGL